MITVTGLAKRYGGRPVFDSVTFTVPRGGSTALWGANGAGKSTTLRCLLGLTRFEGEARVDGLDPRTDPREVRRRVGYVPQEFTCFDMTVRESLEFFGDLKRVPDSRGREVLMTVGLLAEREKPVAALSGGMRQRLALALALLADPPVLLLDEPTASLDAASRQHLLTLLGAMRQAGKTLLFATHRPEEVLALADTVLMMEDGRIRATLTAADFGLGGKQWIQTP